MRTVEQLYIRHGVLVDKKFLDGLTEVETNELDQINQALDDAEETRFAPIIQMLAEIEEAYE